MGPLLFLIYINDVVQVVINTPVTKLRLYANDCVLYSSLCSATDQVLLNDVFSSFFEWSRTLQMELNFQKTVTMTSTNKKEPLQFKYGNAKHALGNIQEFKYLGIPANLAT